jgi:hypothetical protein
MIVAMSQPRGPFAFRAWSAMNRGLRIGFSFKMLKAALRRGRGLAAFEKT